MMGLQDDVLAELEWDPIIQGLAVDVIVDDGMVTLQGSVATAADRDAAESVVWRLRGVRSVDNRIEVRGSHEAECDAALARVASTCLQNNAFLPADELNITVRDGWITLSGQVAWQHQRMEAESVVRRLRGVRGVTNLITLAPMNAAHDTAQRIEAALGRCADLDAQWIMVEAYKGRVVLRGSVRSWSELRLAESVAWRAPGVVEVLNQLAVSP